MSKEQRNAKGSGSFKINSDGTVTYRKSVGYKSDGRRKVLTVTAATKTSCIRAMRKKEDDWKKKRESAYVQMTDTVVELCYRHLQYQVGNGALKNKSIDRRECTIENQIKPYFLGTMQVQAVSSVEVETLVDQLVQEQKISAASILKVVDVLNAAYDWAIKRGDLTENPVRAIKPELKKKINKKSGKGANEADVEILSETEISMLVEEASAVYSNGKLKYAAGDYCLLLLYTGMRVGEMIALRWKDWDGETLTIDKSISMANGQKPGQKGRNWKSLYFNGRNYEKPEGEDHTIVRRGQWCIEEA